MERKKVINGLTVFFCEIYKCYLTAHGCKKMQERTETARKIFLTSDLPRTKSEISFVLDPLVFNEKCPCNSPISDLESN